MPRENLLVIATFTTTATAPRLITVHRDSPRVTRRQAGCRSRDLTSRGPHRPHCLNMFPPDRHCVRLSLKRATVCSIPVRRPIPETPPHVTSLINAAEPAGPRECHSGGSGLWRPAKTPWSTPSRFPKTRRMRLSTLFLVDLGSRGLLRAARRPFVTGRTPLPSDGPRLQSFLRRLPWSNMDCVGTPLLVAHPEGHVPGTGERNLSSAHHGPRTGSRSRLAPEPVS